MNGLIHFNGSVCTHVFVCVRACREKRIPLLPSPRGLYHTARRHIQTNNSFIRNLKYRVQGKFNSFIACNSLLATLCLLGGAQEWGHTWFNTFPYLEFVSLTFSEIVFIKNVCLNLVVVKESDSPKDHSFPCRMGTGWAPAECISSYYHPDLTLNDLAGSSRTGFRIFPVLGLFVKTDSWAIANVAGLLGGWSVSRSEPHFFHTGIVL